jgi:hypothetical protein
MTTNNEIFGKYVDETGEAHYCPINEVADGHIVSEWEMDNCVDVSTVERYAGNLTVTDQGTAGKI